ncbi:MAG: DUF3160 domain-containing protein [Candidatus Limnocylindrales bacterium]
MKPTTASRRGLLALILASTLAVTALPAGAGTELPILDTGFGDYQLVPRLDDDVPYAGPDTPSSLDAVGMTEQVERLLSPAARAKLAGQGFVIVPEEFRLFHHAYDEQFYAGTPVFVTTDAAYHAWHQVFDKTLRDLEGRRLAPLLEGLLVEMRRNAKAQRKDLAGTALEDEARRVLELVSVALAELRGEKVKLSERATAEQRLIRAHDEVTTSPILGTVTDYTLFAPRGHYTRSKVLERYFVAMSVLGQHAFRLPGSVQTDGTVVRDVDALRLALLAARTFVSYAGPEGDWRSIYEPTAFLVGVADDYTPFELEAAVRTVHPAGLADPVGATSDEVLYAVADTLVSTRPVRIDPERPSVRLMGTRFVIDSWIMDELISPNVGDGDALRVLASPLDVAAAFGSAFALAVQDEAGETAYRHYPEQMAAMRAAVASRPDEAWGQTVYDAWLSAIEPMWLPHGEAFPDFMRTAAWDAKSHQSGFGSYAELRHDTVLYTKQFVGEMGSTAPKLPPVRNWVEPDPVAFARLSAMATLTREGLEARGLLPNASRQLLDDYIGLVDRLARLAADELAAKPIERGKVWSDADNEWLRTIGGVLEGFWWRTGDKLKSDRPIRDDDAAVIADIGRGVDLQQGTDDVLEIGTGRIDRIFVLVPDDEGDFHVATGGVYSYYEFHRPTADGRLTDEEWWRMLRKGEVPARPAWQQPLFP